MDSASERDEVHLTVANEDYLECIVRLEGAEDSQNGVRSVDIAQCMHVSKASVNKAVATLRQQGMVEQSHYGKVMITPKGRQVGQTVWRRHRFIRAFLVRELGVDFDRADHEACEMEHALSDDTMRRWVEYLERQGIAVEEADCR
ncbi:MAG: metal-dependent transcriptional regulator [Coriobacteriaceae bacterium]|nr:metal-dependent transcriptional regulator [Coriobacteriaceae bacterium]